MGRDKDALTIGGQTLLERAEDLARLVAGAVRICGPASRFGPDAVEDVYPGCGPLAGIHAALACTTTELNLILAVDTPFITRTFLEFLLDQARQSAAIVTVPCAGGRFQPLCAIYRREFGAIAQKALSQGRNKIDALFSETSVRQIGDSELVKLAFDIRMFDNLNTPQDFERAQRRT